MCIIQWLLYCFHFSSTSYRAIFVPQASATRTALQCSLHCHGSRSPYQNSMDQRRVFEFTSGRPQCQNDNRNTLLIFTGIRFRISRAKGKLFLCRRKSSWPGHPHCHNGNSRYGLLVYKHLMILSFLCLFVKSRNLTFGVWFRIF